MKKEVREGYKKYEFGIIPNDWRIKKIGDIFNDLRAGSTPSRKVEEYYTGNIAWITSGELKYKVIYDTLENITEQAVKDTNLEVYPKGTFFIAITGLEATGTRGSCAISAIKATTNQSCLAFKPKEGFSNLYLYHWYRLYGDYIGLKYTQGTKQQSLNNKIVQELEIPVPKLEEQEKIASILSTVDEQIDNTEKLIQKNQELKKGLMQQLLTKGIGHTKFKKTEIGDIPEEWEVRKLGDIVTICYGKSQKDVEVDNGKYKILGTGGVIGYTNSFLWDKPSVLIGRKGTIDRPQYIEEPFWTVDTLFYTKISDNNSARWFYYYLNNIDLKKYNEATGVPSLSVNNLNTIKISVPSFEEQEKIASILSSVDEKIEEYENKKEKLEELKKGLMQQLLTGKIRVV